jgi:glycosyltransferase involved in cell wall biosynthesis
VAPSAFVADLLERSGIRRDRVHVVPSGVPLSPRVTDEVQPRFVLFLGRISAEKGIRTLLAAARLRPQIPIVFAGEGPLAAEVSRSVGANVSYAGNLKADGVRTALQGAAFTVLPSEWYENLPFAALESFAAGRAVVATRIGGLPEIVNHNRTGLLVPPNDPPALAEAMARLWKDRLNAIAMGQRARQVAAERYSLETHITRTLSLYTDLDLRGVEQDPSSGA